MSDGVARAVDAAIASSAIVRAARPIIAGSLLCRVLGRIAAGARQSAHRVAAGLDRRTANPDDAGDARLGALVAHSRLLDAPRAVKRVVVTAWLHAATVSAVTPAHDQGAGGLIAAAGAALIVAVLTHTVLLALIGIPVHALGWRARAVLGLGGLALHRRPEPWAAAWRDKLASRV
jgi:hypothetical protein